MDCFVSILFWFLWQFYSWKITSKLFLSHSYKPGLLHDLTRDRGIKTDLQHKAQTEDT